MIDKKIAAKVLKDMLSHEYPFIKEIHIQRDDLGYFIINLGIRYEDSLRMSYTIQKNLKSIARRYLRIIVGDEKSKILQVHFYEPEEKSQQSLQESKIPIALVRRLDWIDKILKDVVKMYDVDEFSKLEFIDEVLHSIYDELDYDDVNEFFEYIRPEYEEKIGKIYDYKQKRRNSRKNF